MTPGIFIAFVIGTFIGLFLGEKSGANRTRKEAAWKDCGGYRLDPESGKIVWRWKGD